MLLQVLAAVRYWLHLGVYCSGYSHPSGKCMHVSTIVNNDAINFRMPGQRWVPNHGSCHNVPTSKETRKEI